MYCIFQMLKKKIKKKYIYAHIHICVYNGRKIRAAAFGENVDRFYSKLEKGGVYKIGNGKIILAKKEYSYIKNEYAILLVQGMQMTRCKEKEENSDIAMQKYNFVNIADVATKKMGEFVDIIGCVEYVGVLICVDISSSENDNDNNNNNNNNMQEKEKRIKNKRYLGGCIEKKKKKKKNFF
ncbi:hypothetical protein RFI_19670 [Reticulomyxa filosa]|uniref:Uncharacterized protein n=1 Tax=Reticulomyxa filosa TaxID=46433 RepID=X6MX33_RETFI|nr:hypothetical protein RFI_19670 [Reticulomyxa filosa]|eukprot:ETO17650.1 hypothetical protein RFI_19670 [Reticulomyxa filosa]